MELKERNILSKQLSFILRHDPLSFGIVLDAQGYCSLEELLSALASQKKWSHAIVSDIEQVVSECEKQRFEIVAGRIRARYGHSKPSVEVSVATPPATLIHGTNTKVLSLILETGLKKMDRQYVHLSESLGFATLAGKRRGKVAYVQVDTASALTAGVKFRYAGNEVWLSDDIPASCLIELVV